ncbi:MAG TPA: M20/M25/M40 family metallo-hydrolase [Bacteroidales bacterium]|nr:M20/M25/M40 family metallo-hydrolase [Bacteroidales bacterium]HPD22896.1 M20/M25/M40 family metallo-hydrolase [Bacteroidales bacterium]HRS98563.1 M20/M25/M40 family metallo-hydrolase [Bacteroidales bacterium]HRT80746.1 M20/M25/M40 family metallo-hydrolase [Bacteroidales bacterium]
MKFRFFKRFLILFLSFTLSIQYAISQRESISTESLKQHVYTLASEEFGGRPSGGDEEFLTINYIVEYLESLNFSSVQTDFFVFDTDIDYGENNSLNSGGKNFTFNKDYTVTSFSANKSLSSELYFCGYGFNILEPDFIWNDYYEASKIKGKWVMIFRGIPNDLPDTKKFEKYSSDQYKIRTAADMGAGGVILVSPEKFDEDDNLIKLRRNLGRVNIPVIHVKRSAANEILKKSNYSIEELDKIISSRNKPWSMLTKIKVNASTELRTVEGQSSNIVTYITGSDPVLRHQYIVIGAHYDHLGMGGPSTLSRVPDISAIHYGADDNASGVALLLEIAKYFKNQPIKPKRSLIFVAFGAEERGLLGSKFFVENPFTDLKNIVLMINLDMVGRLKPEKVLSIGGTGTFTTADSILNVVNKNFNFKLVLSPEGSGPSDHAPFYAKNIPVLFFSSGMHLDYHTPSDTPDKINYEGMKEIGDYLISVIKEIDKIRERPIFTEASPSSKENSRHGGNLKVSLGKMPDIAATNIEGLRVEVATPGKPAHNAGMKNGDIIKSINGMPVKDIEEYMFRLSKLNPGEQIKVEVERENQRIELMIQL